MTHYKSNVFTNYTLKKVIFFGLCGLVFALVAIYLITILRSNISLKKTHANIEKTYQNVQHIDAQFLKKTNKNKVLIFDVRQPEEFKVSHIKEAIQINPDIELDSFKKKFSGLVSGKIVIFYCSVGVRSSALASRLESTLQEASVSAYYNLKGGVFQWHNDSRPLIKDNGISTENIHPYSDHWGQLIKNKMTISYF